MRYNHESYLPIGAFQPILGRMTLHGGGGGFISDAIESVSDFISPVTDVFNDAVIQPISDVFAGADDMVFQPITAPISQATSALDDAIIQPITEPISDVGVAIDDAVAEVIPGGWGTLAQIAAAIATSGSSLAVQAAAAAAAAGGSKFAKDKDLKSALEAAAIAGGTAGVTQGVGKEFGLGDLGKAGLSAGLSGGVDYAKTGDINSALRAGAKAGAMSYGGSQLAPYVDPYLSEIKGDFGKFLQEQGVNLSNLANPSTALDTNLSEAPQMASYDKELEYQKFQNEMMERGYSPAKLTTDVGEVVQGSFNNDFKAVPNFGESSLGDFENQPDLQKVSNTATDKIPNAKIEENKIGIGSVPFDFDTPVYYDGYVPMTPAQVAADNPTLYPNGQVNEPGTVTYYGLPKEYKGLGEEAINQKYNNLPGAISEQYANQDLTEGYDKVKFRDDPVAYLASRGIEGKDYVINKATGAIDYLSKTNPLDYPGDLYDAAKDYYDKSSPTKLALTAAGLYGLSSLGGGKDSQGKSQAQIDEEEEAKRVYTYGTSTSSGSNYIPKNRINSGNVYSAAAGYRPLNRYADGGEVQHYGIGGKVADLGTRLLQPFEKAILRPIGEAAPFLKDLAPYAGIAAGAMMGNPYVGGAVGGIASGFGKPGGFDFKRAFMGGVASYGMSNLMSGLEAAGTPESALPFYPEAPIQPSGIVGSDTMFVPQGPSQAALQSMAKTDLANAPRDIFSIRNPEAIQKGIGNLLQNSNTPAYKDAMAALTNKTTGINMYNTGLPLVMGTTGIMGVDESNELKKQYDSSLMGQREEEAAFNARVAAGKKRAQQAVSENPYRFAMGGSIDDEYGSDDMNTVNGNMQNGFMGYADGGPVTNAEDLEFMTQLENNRNEVDPMSDSRYAGLLKQNQDYLSTIYGNIYNQPTPQPVAPPAAVAPSVEPTPLTGAIAPSPPPPPPPPTVAPLDIETVRANANRALDMSEEVQNNVRDSSRAVEKAQALIGTASATPPPPVYQSPNATPAGQYMVRNPYGPEPLNASNIYQYQKKKQRGYAEGGIPRFLSGGGDGMSDSIKANIEGSQEARLADGEFVIPADVVSHLGNGSSKAGAKQLYDMMDRVRKARTGNRKQGREIKPTKLMPV